MPTVEKRVKAIMGRILHIDPDEIQAEHSFTADLHAENFQSLVSMFNDAFGIKMDEDAALHVETVGSAVELIGRTCAEQWSLWRKGEVVLACDGIQPLLASWDRNDHPAQICLRRYLEGITSALTPLPKEGDLYLELSVDVEIEERLSMHYDVENYLTPLFGSRYLNQQRFAFVRGTKYVGGGSRIELGFATSANETMNNTDGESFTMNAGSGASTPEWKQRLHQALSESGCSPLPEGLVDVHLGWRCSSRRNWVNLWKPTGDTMGPVLGYYDPNHPFNPRDDRIVSLSLHRVTDDLLGDDVCVGMWWQTHEDAIQ